MHVSRGQGPTGARFLHPQQPTKTPALQNEDGPWGKWEEEKKKDSKWEILNWRKMLGSNYVYLVPRLNHPLSKEMRTGDLGSIMKKNKVIFLLPQSL